jgi:methylenetetrahydrofolate reductase (NADPH)
MEERLWEAIVRLAPLGPEFMSVTYGAGGSTRERTHNTVRRILDETDVTPAAHLTCVGSTRKEVDAVARAYWDAGVRHIVALRGDPPDGESRFAPHPGGYACGAELVAGLREVGDFDISVAGYPEVHPDAESPDAELAYLKRKVEAGACRIITQYFFDTDLFLRFRDRVTAAGIEVPIVPGIMPVTNFHTLARFSAACGATVPTWLAGLFDGLDDDPDTRRLVAATVASEQCMALHEEGVNEFHFYTLNRAELTKAICRMLGVVPRRGLETDSESAASARKAAIQ